MATLDRLIEPSDQERGHTSCRLFAIRQHPSVSHLDFGPNVQPLVVLLPRLKLLLRQSPFLDLPDTRESDERLRGGFRRGANRFSALLCFSPLLSSALSIIT